MSTDPESPTPDSRSTPDDFQELLAECLARIESDGTGALDAFRAEHPAFASRLGKQLDWLVEHLAQQKAGLPETIGPYRIQQRLGKGGMGEVYLAEQTTPFRRPVAVKVIRFGRQTESRVARFAREIQALASLNHNGIAKVFEAGSEGGRPFFSMEYVPGKPITDYCRDEQLDLAARLQLFVEVCRAVEYAHRQGIIHRDLKPSNILVYGPATEPVPKIIDFGLAKAIEGQRSATRTASLVGTPDYMSPEQVDDSGHAIIDTRADVYALGVVLYELLTGMLPLSLWQLGAENVHAMVRAIREREPSSPSVRVEETASDTSTSPRYGRVSPRKLSRLLAGDVDSIVMKALAKNADRRYGGAAQLADDILRYLRHEPVSAVPPTRRYLLRKFVRRHRAGVWFSLSASVLIVASLMTIYLQGLESQRNLERGNLFGLAQFLGELRRRDSTHPPAARPERIAELRTWLGEFEALASQRDRMAALLAESAHGPPDATNPAHWSTGRNAQQALRAALERTLAELDRMTTSDGEIERVRRRLDWAGEVVARTVSEHRDDWERVRREVLADPRFEGLDLEPQIGLIPVGRDQKTGLQEFVLPLPGGELPGRVDGRWQIGARTWPVFVLLPGGRTRIGCQDTDPGQPRFDRMKQAFEGDVEQVLLDPFFASRFEATNGQWQLMSREGVHPDPDDPLRSPTLPVVSIDLMPMLHAVHAWGMRLPTPAEWEYLARGGSDDPFWCGETADTLEGNENLYDEQLDEMPGAVGEGVAVPWSDGFALTAPVGTFPCNAYLLHDVLGNVCEITYWETGNEWFSEVRASSWHEGARDARATARFHWDGNRKPAIGFRPVISVRR